MPDLMPGGFSAWAPPDLTTSCRLIRRSPARSRTGGTIFDKKRPGRAAPLPGLWLSPIVSPQGTERTTGIETVPRLPGEYHGITDLSSPLFPPRLARPARAGSPVRHRATENGTPAPAQAAGTRRGRQTERRRGTGAGPVSAAGRIRGQDARPPAQGEQEPATRAPPPRAPRKRDGPAPGTRRAPGRTRTTPHHHRQVAGKLPASYQGTRRRTPSATPPPPGRQTRRDGAAPPKSTRHPQNKRGRGGADLKKGRAPSAPPPPAGRGPTPALPTTRPRERARHRKRAPAGARSRRTTADTPGGSGSTPHPGELKPTRRYAGTYITRLRATAAASCAACLVTVARSTAVCRVSTAARIYSTISSRSWVVNSSTVAVPRTIP